MRSREPVPSVTTVTSGATCTRPSITSWMEQKNVNVPAAVNRKE